MPIITMTASNFELRLMFLYFGNFNLKTFSICSYFTYSISPKYYLQLKCYLAAALGIGSELPLMWVWRSGVMRFTVHHGRGGDPGVPVSPLCNPFFMQTTYNCYEAQVLRIIFQIHTSKTQNFKLSFRLTWSRCLQTPKRNK